MSARDLATLHFGRHETALAGIEVDHVITDPPYGKRTHKGQTHTRSGKIGAKALSEVGLVYPYFTGVDVINFVQSWAPRTRKWFCTFTSHDLIPAYENALEAVGRYVFAPISCVIPGMNVRLQGDGPSNWTVWLIVSRPIGMRPLWGSLPGSYRCARETRKDGLRISGSKPLALMRDIVSDYSHEGDTIADPYAGVGVTLEAAALQGRKAIGAECARDTFELGQKRLDKGLSFPRAEAEVVT